MSTRNFLFSLLLLLGAASSVACTSPECPSKAGCVCDDKAPCDKGLLCVEKICKQESNTSHNETPSQESLIEQDAGPTERCEPGVTGCRCVDQESCAAGLRCEGGVCRPCLEGSAGCACRKGECDGSLVCEKNRCTRCEGKAFCACYKNQQLRYRRTLFDKRRWYKHLQALFSPRRRRLRLRTRQPLLHLVALHQQTLPTPCGSCSIAQNSKVLQPMRRQSPRSRRNLSSCHPPLRLLEGCLVGPKLPTTEVVSPPHVLTNEAHPYIPLLHESQRLSNLANLPPRSLLLELQIRLRMFHRLRLPCVCVQPKMLHLKKTECPTDDTCQNTSAPPKTKAFAFLAFPARRDAAIQRTKISEVFRLSEKEMRFNNRVTTGEIAIVNKRDFDTTIQITRESDTTGESQTSFVAVCGYLPKLHRGFPSTLSNFFK